jgi:hypothetical protein
MLKRKKIIYFLLLIPVLVLFSARMTNAQSSVDYNWYFNANGGATSFFGDVQNKDFSFSNLSNQTDFGFGGRLGKYISPVFAIHLQGIYTNLKGEKQSHDLKFTTDLSEAQLGVTVNFSNLFGGAKSRTVSIYGFTGFGGIFFTSDARQLSTGLPVDESENVIGTPDNESQTALIIPAGLGIDFKLAPKLYFNLETGLRLINSDKPDGIVSGSRKDTYYYSSLGLSFDFGKKKVKKRKETSPEVTEIPKPVDDSMVDLVYHLPERVKSNHDFILEYEINKGDIDGKAELTQVLPIGFEVLDTVIGNARVEFQNYTLNLYWDELPQEPVFTVKYKVHIKDVYGVLPLSTIMYLEKTGKQYRYKTNIYVANVKNIPVANTVKDTLPKEKPEPVIEKVIFKVQIRAAYKSEIPLQLLANKYHLRDEIKEDYVGNWYRYSVGSFATYEEAKQYRNQIRSINGLRDAFVVAYRDGKRLDKLSELKQMTPDEQTENTEFKEKGRYYRIQILALKYNRISPETLKEVLNIDEDITEEKSHSWRKYTIGRFSSLEDAKILKQKMIDKGIADAFVVIYNNGRRITR